MHNGASRSAWRLIGAVLAVCTTGLLYPVSRPFCSQESCGREYRDKATDTTDSFPGSCTTFAASYGDVVLFGNNEDFGNRDTYVWAVSSGKETYGGVYLGYKYGRPQGGINEKGLAYDALALPATRLNPRPELPPKGEGDTQFLGKIMSHCATVEEAIAFAQGFNWGSSVSFQVLLADATGAAVIISGGPDRELAFTKKPEGDGYLVGTNFNRADPENRSGGFPCWRYDTAVAMLGQIGTEADLDAGYFQSILDAVHVEGAEENTLYSNVFDLRNGAIYMTYWHQYDQVVTLSVTEEMAKDTPPTRLRELFSQETVAQAAEEHQRHLKRAAREDWLNRYAKIVILGAFPVLLGLLGLVVYWFRRKRRHRRTPNVR